MTGPHVSVKTVHHTRQLDAKRPVNTQFIKYTPLVWGSVAAHGPKVILATVAAKLKTTLLLIGKETASANKIMF